MGSIVAHRTERSGDASSIQPSELAVFYAGLDVGVGIFDELVERCGVWDRSRFELHVAHVLAGALQQARRIEQGCAVKESHVDVRREYVDIGEGRIAEAGDRTAVVEELADLIAALAHDLKPLARDGSQLTFVLFHPRMNGGIALDGAVESEQFGFHRARFPWDLCYAAHCMCMGGNEPGRGISGQQRWDGPGDFWSPTHAVQERICIGRVYGIALSRISCCFPKGSMRLFLLET